MNSNFDQLIEAATRARGEAYAPYSKFAVGAALLTKGGRIVTGCNVENLSFGLTICAERAAVFAAVAMGEREFEAIAVVADSKTPVTPCGACRQVLAEFAGDLPICSANLEGERFESTLRELLPRAKEGILGA
jgi:cytidine deaminase